MSTIRRDFELPKAPAATDCLQIGVAPKTIRAFVHGLRSHLTAIGPAAEYMVGDSADPAVRDEMARIICTAVGRIDGMLADLAVLAVPERQGPGAPLCPIDLTQVARTVAGAHSTEAQEIGAWLVVDAAGSAEVLGHDRALHQVVSNALLLVLKLARAGDRVMLSLAAAEDAQLPQVQLSVELQTSTDAGHRREPVHFDGVPFDAACLIASQHGGTLDSLTDRTGLVLRLPVAPQSSRPAAAMGAREPVTSYYPLTVG